MFLNPREEKNTKAGQDPSHYMQNGGKESQKKGEPHSLIGKKNMERET